MKRVLFLVFTYLCFVVFNLYSGNIPGIPQNSPRNIQINSKGGVEDDKYTKAAIEAVKKNAEIAWDHSSIDKLDTIETPQDLQPYVSRISAISENAGGGKKTFLVYFETVDYMEKKKERTLTKQSQLCETFFEETFNPDSLETQILAKYFHCIRINVTDYDAKMDAKSPISSKNAPIVVIADENGAILATITKKNRSSAVVFSEMMNSLKGKKINVGKMLAKIKNLYDVLMIGAQREYFVNQAKFLLLQAKGQSGRSVSAQAMQKAQEDSEKAKEKLEALKKDEIAIYNTFGAELPVKP